MLSAESHVNKCQSARIVLIFAQQCHLIDEKKVNVTESCSVSVKNGLNGNCLLLLLVLLLQIRMRER